MFEKSRFYQSNRQRCNLLFDGRFEAGLVVASYASLPRPHCRDHRSVLHGRRKIGSKAALPRLPVTKSRLAFITPSRMAARKTTSRYRTLPVQRRTTRAMIRVETKLFVGRVARIRFSDRAGEFAANIRPECNFADGVAWARSGETSALKCAKARSVCAVKRLREGLHFPKPLVPFVTENRADHFVRSETRLHAERGDQIFPARTGLIARYQASNRSLPRDGPCWGNVG